MTDVREVIARAIKADRAILIGDGWYDNAADRIIAALTEAGVLLASPSECESCAGLNTSCPKGCERDPETGELL